MAGYCFVFTGVFCLFVYEQDSSKSCGGNFREIWLVEFLKVRVRVMDGLELMKSKSEVENTTSGAFRENIGLWLGLLFAGRHKTQAVTNAKQYLRCGRRRILRRSVPHTKLHTPSTVSRVDFSPFVYLSVYFYFYLFNTPKQQ